MFGVLEQVKNIVYLLIMCLSNILKKKKNQLTQFSIPKISYLSYLIDNYATFFFLIDLFKQNICTLFRKLSQCLKKVTIFILLH